MDFDLLLIRQIPTKTEILCSKSKEGMTGDITHRFSLRVLGYREQAIRKGGREIVSRFFDVFPDHLTLSDLSPNMIQSVGKKIVGQ